MAISPASYSAGNRVYSGGSDAPQRGVLDPLAYRQRELNKGTAVTSPVTPGMTPQAQQMVLLQRAAQNRMAQSAQSNGTGINGTQMAQAQTATPQATTTSVATTSSPTSTATGQILPRTEPLTQTNPSTPQTEDAASLQRQQQAAADARQNLINANNAAPVPTTAATSVPATTIPVTDAQYGVDATTAQTGYNTILQQLQQAQQQEGLTYGQNLRNESLQEPIAYRQLLDNAAAHGMANSSGYGYNVGQQAASFQRTLDDLNAAHTQATTGFTSEGTTASNNLASTLSALQAAAASRLAAQAGSLGLSSTPTAVSTASTNSTAGLPPSQGGTPSPGTDTWINGVGWVNKQAYDSRHPILAKGH